MSMLPRKSNASSSRFWKWRARSTKSTSEAESRDDTAPSSPFASSSGFASPPGQFTARPFTPTPLNGPMSPFLTESAHVLSLQNPDSCSPGSRSQTQMSEARTMSSSAASTTEHSAFEASFNESVVRLPAKSVSSTGSAKRFYFRTMSKFKSKGHTNCKEVHLPT